jgi:hypothetical protein
MRLTILLLSIFVLVSSCSNKTDSLRWEDLIIKEFESKEDAEFQTLMEWPIFTVKQLSFHKVNIEITGVILNFEEACFIMDPNMNGAFHAPPADKMIELMDFECKSLDSDENLIKNVTVSGTFVVNNNYDIYSLPYQMINVVIVNQE